MKYFKIINDNNTESFIQCDNADNLTLTNCISVTEISKSEYDEHKTLLNASYIDDTDGIPISKVKYSNYII